MPRYTEAQAREAVAASLCYSEVLRRLGLRVAGGNHKLLRRYVDEVWTIPTDHFDDAAARRMSTRARRGIPLDEVLVEGSSYSRKHLKQRLYDTGLKERRCELCGQDECWRGARMSLILDHVNGIPDDNRIDNLKIVCPNCAATLDTHCGRKNRLSFDERPCPMCATSFTPRRPGQQFCSQACGCRHPNRRRQRLDSRRVDRPPYSELRAEIAATSFAAVGRKYGVSGNAVRKWLRAYEQEAQADEI